MKSILKLIPFVLWPIGLFYALHFLALVITGLFWSNWFFLIFLSLLLSGFAFAILYNGHGLYNLVKSIVGSSWLWVFLFNIAATIGLLFALGYLGNYTNAISWDDKIFMLSSFWEYSPVRTVIVSIPFLSLALGITYVLSLGLVVGKIKDIRLHSKTTEPSLLP